MASTAITDYTTEHILLNPGDADAKWVWGYLAADTAPGQWVIHDSTNNQWLKLDTDTSAAHGLSSGVGVVGYHKRINQTTGALKIITDNYDVSEVEDKRAPIILSGICVAYITDQGATLYVGENLTASSTGGSVTVMATPVVAATVGTVAHIVIDDDTVAIVGIGNCKGRHWGGV